MPQGIEFKVPNDREGAINRALDRIARSFDYRFAVNCDGKTGHCSNVPDAIMEKVKASLEKEGFDVINLERKRVRRWIRERLGI